MASMFWAHGLSITVSTAQAQNIEMIPESQPLLMGRHMTVLSSEASQDLMEQDILQGKFDHKFIKSTQEFLNFGMGRHHLWLRFSIHNATEVSKDYILEGRSAFIDSISLYQKDSSGQERVSTVGDRMAFEQRDVTFRQPSFRLKVAPGTTICYIKIVTEGSLFFHPHLWSADAFSGRIYKDSIIIGLFYGFVMVMLFFNAFLALFFRTKVYVLYTFYILTFLLAQTGIQGSALQWFDFTIGSWLSNQGFVIFVNLSMLLGWLFSAAYLNMKQYLPWGNTSLKGLAWVNGLLAVGTFFISHAVISKLTSVTFMVAVVVLLTAGTISIVRGYRPAIIYTLAWATLLLGTALGTLFLNGLIPASPLVEWGNFGGGALEVVLLSIGLIDRFHVEQAKAQHTIHTLNIELTRHIHEVEGIVTERTAKLKSILDHVKSGFLAVDSIFRIQEGFTRSCSGLFGHELQPGMTLFDVLDLDERQKGTFRSAIRQVFADELPDDVSLEQIPRLYKLGRRFLSFEGSVVRDDAQRILSILFTITDVTSLRKKQRQAQLAQKLLHIQQNRDAFNAFVRYAREQLQDLKSGTNVLKRSEIQFSLHTLKGNFLIFGLQTQAHIVHRLEEKTMVEESDIEVLSASLERFLAQNSSILNLDMQNGDKTIPVTLEQLDQLKERLLELGHPSKIRAALDHWQVEVRAETARSLLGPLDKEVEVLARRAGLNISFEIQGGDIRVSGENEKLVVKSLVHLVRNAVIHGFCNDQSFVPESPGYVRLSFEADEQGLHIRCQDNGLGMERAAIESIIVKANKGTPADCATRTLTELFEILSLNGNVTINDSSLYEGRRVGVAAVFSAVNAAQGQIAIDSTPRQGCRFSLVIPRQAVTPSTYESVS